MNILGENLPPATYVPGQGWFGLCAFCRRWVKHRGQGGRAYMFRLSNLSESYVFCYLPRCPESIGATLEDLWECKHCTATVTRGNHCYLCKRPKEGNQVTPWPKP